MLPGVILLGQKLEELGDELLGILLVLVGEPGHVLELIEDLELEILLLHSEHHRAELLRDVVLLEGDEALVVLLLFVETAELVDWVQRLDY